MTLPLIVVVNGTAMEGFWAVHYLIESGRFRVRATARRPDSDKARALRDLGCEVAAARTEDPEALKAAFNGAEGIYGTTIYNIHGRKNVHENLAELAQGRALIEAASACETLEHFVFQTMTRFEQPPPSLELPEPIHFRTKWALEQEVIDAGLPWTLLRQPAYLRQLKFGMRGRRRVSYPYAADARLSFVAEEDLGKIIARLFERREEFLHQTINGVSVVITPAELARRAHQTYPQISSEYRRASRLYNWFFDRVVVGLKPAFAYPMQINHNLMAGNFFAMTQEDQAFCADLVAPDRLMTVEDWFHEYLGNYDDRDTDR